MRRRLWTELDQPLRARKPATWVMPDVFAPGWTDEMRDKQIAIVALCSHQWFVLHTDHHSRMLAYIAELYAGNRKIGQASDGMFSSALVSRLAVAAAFGVGLGSGKSMGPHHPIPNLSLWSTIRDQSEADRIVPQLLGCPAAVRGVRAVLRRPVDLTAIKWKKLDLPYGLNGWSLNNVLMHRPANAMNQEKPAIRRLRIAGETGRDAAPCNVQWIRSLAEQAERAGMRPGVDVVVERLGSVSVMMFAEWLRSSHAGRSRKLDHRRHREIESLGCVRIELDSPTGSDPAEWPDDLRRFAEKEQQA